MESSNYLEHLGVNGTVLDPANQSLDLELENIQDIGTPFDQPSITALLFVLYTAVFILIFFGNLAVVLVTTLHWRMRKTATFCLFHLAIANLCVGIFCVYQNLSLYLIESWIFGDLMCKMYFFIMSLSYTASILILVIIAIERYVVIMHPFQGRQLMTVGKLQIIITLVWILSGVICFHRFYSVSTSENPLPGGGMEIICSPNVLLHNHKAVDLANFLLLFLLPLLVISVLYTRLSLYLKRYSFNFRPVDVTPSRTTRSSTEMETLERVLSNLTPRAERSSPRFKIVQRRFLKTSQSWTPGDKYEAGQRHRRLSSSDPVLNNRVRNDCETSGGKKIPVAHSSDSFSDSDPSETNYRSDNVEMRSRSMLMQRRAMRNRVEPVSLSYFPRLNNVVQWRNGSNTWRFFCLRRTQTLNQQLGQPNANQKAVVRMLVVIVITFALCNFPFHLRKMCQNYFAPCELDHPLFELVTPATFLSMYANCAINPFIYAFMHRRFRVCFVELLSRRCRRINRRN